MIFWNSNHRCEYNANGWAFEANFHHAKKLVKLLLMQINYFPNQKHPHTARLPDEYSVISEF